MEQAKREGCGVAFSTDEKFNFIEMVMCIFKIPSVTVNVHIVEIVIVIICIWYCDRIFLHRGNDLYDAGQRYAFPDLGFLFSSDPLIRHGIASCCIAFSGHDMHNRS